MASTAAVSSAIQLTNDLNDESKPSWGTADGGGTTTHTMTVTKVGPGLVTSRLAGIRCGADCTESYATGTSIILRAGLLCLSG